MRIIKTLKTTNYRMWFSILSTMLLPMIFPHLSNNKIFLLEDMPSDSGINIASWLQWVDLFYEVT